MQHEGNWICAKAVFYDTISRADNDCFVNSITVVYMLNVTTCDLQIKLLTSAA